MKYLIFTSNSVNSTIRVKVVRLGGLGEAFFGAMMA